MTSGDAAAVLGAAAVFVTALAALVSSWRNGRKIADVHELVNGQSAQLRELIELRAYLAGHTAGVTDEQGSAALAAAQKSRSDP